MGLSPPAPNVATVADLDPARALQALAAWPELDTAIGVRSLNGNAAKYLAMLGRLVTLHGGDGQALRRAWSVRNRAEVRRLAHKLRGIAATLGAVRVAAATAALDLPTLDELDVEVLGARVAALDGAMLALLSGLFERASIGQGAPAADQACREL